MINSRVAHRITALENSLIHWITALGITVTLVAIATFAIGPSTCSANVNTAKRNAQNLASVYSSAIAAGSVELPVQTDLDAVIELLENGVECDGYADATFRVPELSDEEAKAAKQYLRLDLGEYPSLTYIEGER